MFIPYSAKKISTVLSDSTLFNRMLNKVRNLTHIQRILSSQISSNARAYCHVASWDKNKLTISVTSASWATKLRYQGKLIENNLRKFDELSSLSRISFKVYPRTELSKTKIFPRSISQESIKVIQESSKKISDPELRIALERLSRK